MVSDQYVSLFFTITLITKADSLLNLSSVSAGQSANSQMLQINVAGKKIVMHLANLASCYSVPCTPPLDQILQTQSLECANDGNYIIL